MSNQYVITSGSFVMPDGKVKEVGDTIELDADVAGVFSRRLSPAKSDSASGDAPPAAEPSE